MKRAVAVIVPFMILMGCVTIPHLSPEQLAWATAKWPDAQSGELEHGRSIYVTRCSSCHAAPEPKEVMEQKDDDMVKEMVDRAKLSPQEQQAVMRFLEAATSPGKAGVAQR